ncbi:hypothetical protein L6164_006627 [Bauhinia variegata]|uniref:Uncharacterized protein n=1 Tax=Bauhinia variegata TaxID=167791 RepID=A0ACB9PX33_BAUVA|nr:hypothetical protein L6164_006627 [Bauhinia variegata]
MVSSNMDPPPCANGCGFYGSAANQNLCSKCYYDLLKEKTHPTPTHVSINLESSIANLSLPSARDIENAAAVAVTASASEEKTKKNRCKNCNKKVGLTGFQCRCGDVFCGRHRYPEEHACKVNLKAKN